MKLLAILLLATAAFGQHTPVLPENITIAKCQADAKLWSSDSFDISKPTMRALLFNQQEMSMCQSDTDKDNKGWDYSRASLKVNLEFFARLQHYIERSG